jgi:hypothetical protein
MGDRGVARLTSAFGFLIIAEVDARSVSWR